MHIANDHALMIKDYGMLINAKSTTETKQAIRDIIKQLTGEDIDMVKRSSNKLTKADYEAYDIDIEKTGVNLN